MACRAGIAVLNAIVKDQLQENALRVGNHIISRVERELKPKHGVIGDVRGLGLFLGIELVLDRVSLKPATRLTSKIIDIMQEEFHVLLGTDGPFNNVIKIKPPLCFTLSDSDFLVNSLDQVLSRHESKM